MKVIYDILQACYNIICWSLVYMWYFNWFLTPIFDIKEINYTQGIALFMFSRLLKPFQIRDLYFRDEKLEYKDNVWLMIAASWICLLLGVFIYSYL